ncbi:MAG TPA: hypothetical protein VNO17_08575 [Actinomycetota bacterium]|nr:hypothetical protein [Actinomycetota bacterium]
MEPTLVLPVPPTIERARHLRVPTPLAERVLVLTSPGRRGFWCTTTGLREFGLPELQIHRVPRAVVVPWSWILTGLALRLLELWAEAVRRSDGGFALLPARVELTADDCARAYGERGPGARRVGLTLRFDPSPNMRGDGFLTVRPPPSRDRSAVLVEICDRLFDRVPREPRAGLR